MANNISIDSNMDDFMDSLNREVSQIDSDVTEALRYAAMKVVTDAKSVDTYTDQTANLRNSIGYAIIDDGNILDNSVQAIEAGEKPDKDGNLVKRPASNGPRRVEEEAKHMVGSKGVVVVAGMPYASFVEQRGYDVLTGSALKLEDYFKEGME